MLVQGLNYRGLKRLRTPRLPAVLFRENIRQKGRGIVFLNPFDVLIVFKYGLKKICGIVDNFVFVFFHAFRSANFFPAPSHEQKISNNGYTNTNQEPKNCRDNTFDHFSSLKQDLYVIKEIVLIAKKKGAAKISQPQSRTNYFFLDFITSNSETRPG